MIKKLGILLFILVVLLFVLLYPLRSGPQIRFDADHCRLVREKDSQVVVECRLDVLYTRSGLYVSLSPDFGFNSVRFELTHSIYYNDAAILVTLFRDDNNPRIEVVLPTGRDYGGKYVTAWNLNIGLYEYVNGTWVYGDSKSLTLSDYPPGGWVITLSPNQYITLVELWASTGIPPQQQQQKPSWGPANDWFRLLNDVLNAVGQGFQAGVSIFVSSLSFLLSILQYLPIIIPLHIVTAFIDSPERGVSAINFYVSLGRKLIDLVVKIAHAIVSLLDAITPFT